MERLLGSSYLASVGRKVHWVDRPQGESLPGLTLTVISPGTNYDHDGRVGLQYARIQLDCWGATYAEAKILSRGVSREMEETFENENIAFDEAFELRNSDEKPDELPGGTKVFRVLMEFNMPFTLKE